MRQCVAETPKIGVVVVVVVEFVNKVGVFVITGLV